MTETNNSHRLNLLFCPFSLSSVSAALEGEGNGNRMCVMCMRIAEFYDKFRMLDLMLNHKVFYTKSLFCILITWWQVLWLMLLLSTFIYFLFICDTFENGNSWD